MDEVARVPVLKTLEEQPQVFVDVDLLLGQPRGEGENSLDMHSNVAIPVESWNQAEARIPGKYSG